MPTVRRVIAAALVALTTLVVAPGASADVDGAPFAVRRSDVTWFDHGRTTDRDNVTGAGTRPFRKIKVMFLVPDAPGPHPLLVWVHGVTGTGPGYEGVLRRFAQAGYAVAAPTMPLTSGAGAWANIGDYANQPGDVRYVIDRAVAGSPSVFDARAVAVGGHSLGAITAIGTTYSDCTRCRDARIAAAIEVAGVELPFPGGTFPLPRASMPTVPLLAVHGGRDATVPVKGSDDLYAKARGRAHYLRIPAGGHADVLVDPLFDDAVVAFLDRYLSADAAGLARLPALASSSGGRVTWSSR